MVNTDPATAPLDESKGTSGTLSLRLPQEMIDRIDTRRGDLSRNAWAAKCFEWVLTYLPTGLKHPERDRVATDAPPEVTGTHRLPAAPHVHRWTVMKDAKDRPTGEKVCPDCGEVRNPPVKPQQEF